MSSLCTDLSQRPMSRLKIWMTPVRDNSAKELGDFTVWSDDSSDSLGKDVHLFAPLDGTNIHRHHQQDTPQQHQRARGKCNSGFGHSTGSSGDAFPSATKRLFRDSSCNSSDGSTTSAGDQVEGAMNMKIGFWKPLPKKTCGFCYIQYKRHCQRLGISYPHATDPGFWAGHTTKDDNGDVICPELRKLMCPLCFATGKKAHTLKFCPFNEQ